MHVTAVCVAEPIGEHGAPPTVTRMLLVVPPSEEPIIVRIDPPCVASDVGETDVMVGGLYENKTAALAALTWLATVTTSWSDTPSPTGEVKMIAVWLANVTVHARPPRLTVGSGDPVPNDEPVSVTTAVEPVGPVSPS